MTEPKSIHRLESTADGLRVVTKDVSNLYSWPDGRPNVLTREYEDLFVHVVSQSEDGTGRLRVGTAARIGDCEGWQIHGANGIYADVAFKTRELSAAEREWCSETFMYRDTESVVEFEIPHPEALRAAIRDQDLARFNRLEAVIEGRDRRHEVLTGLQDRIAEEHVRANQLHPREGILTDIAPEWHPEDSHNDGKTREHLADMASMRKDAHLTDWRSIAGFDYTAFRNARYRVLGISERNLEPYELVPLGVAGYPEWTYCQECGAVGPERAFLRVDLARTDGRRRVCDRCADRKAEYEDGFKNYTPENVARARDERVRESGDGQRNLAGEYD